MVVGDDMPVLVDDEPRAQAAPPELALRPPSPPKKRSKNSSNGSRSPPKGLGKGIRGTIRRCPLTTCVVLILTTAGLSCSAKSAKFGAWTTGI